MKQEKQTAPFAEAYWLELLFMLADMQVWIDKASKDLLAKLPSDSQQQEQPVHFLTVPALAGILKLHYCQPRKAGTFTISIPAIVNLLGKATRPPTPGPASMLRVLTANYPIGFDRKGKQTMKVTVITNCSGEIISAFPGTD